MRFITSSVTLAGAVAFIAVRAGAQDIKLAEEKPGMIVQAKVAYATAITTAQARVPGAKLFSAELEKEHGKLIYSLVFVTEGKKGHDEVNVNAITGAVEGVEHEKSTPDKPKEAKAAAKKGGV